jgi:hypothetical protein
MEGTADFRVAEDLLDVDQIGQRLSGWPCAGHRFSRCGAGRGESHATPCPCGTVNPFCGSVLDRRTAGLECAARAQCPMGAGSHERGRDTTVTGRPTAQRPPAQERDLKIVRRRESAALLSDRGASSGGAAGDGFDRRPPDHGLRGAGVAFIVPVQAAVGGEPGEIPLDGPSPPDDREAALAAGLRTKRSVVFRMVAAQSGGVRRTRRRRTGTAPGCAGGCRALLPRRRRGPVRRPSRPRRTAASEGVGANEPLAAVDLLPGVVAAGLGVDHVGALHCLGVD